MLRFSIFILVASISSCSTTVEKKSNLGEKNIHYYADKTVNSLEIPPDLTKPNQENSLVIDDYINTEKNLVNLAFKDKVIKPINKIEKPNISIKVERDNNRRWLSVDKNTEYIWNAVIGFLKDNNFKIKKSNKKIGILETNYLENKSDIPNRNLGAIRSIFKKTFGTGYSLPTLDRYRVRIENTGSEQTEIYLTLNSLEEVVESKNNDGKTTTWQVKKKDQSIEIEMLYRLMVYLGSDDSAARDKIQAASSERSIKVEIKQDIQGYAKLQFAHNKLDTWNSIAWALDQLGIEVEDKDLTEGSFYIKVAKDDASFMSNIFGNYENIDSFQIRVKGLGPNFTEVYFSNLIGERTAESISDSNRLFTNIIKILQ